MNDSQLNLRINEERYRNNFEALAQIGATPDGGLNRPTFSQEHLAARKWLLEYADKAGLESRIDGVANHSIIHHCGKPEAKTILLGSHLDSVPYGGRFDGALGVLAALEVVETIKDNNIPLEVDLEVIDFTDEEGSWVNLFGSRAFIGTLQEYHLQAPKIGTEAFQEALARTGLSNDSVLTAKREPEKLAAYLELHIEQGTRLLDAGMHIGVVTGMVGIRSFDIKFIGRADHAGTSAMGIRLDASLGASAFNLAAREIVMRDFPGCVVNIGKMQFEPGAFNIVPEVVTLSLEFRADNIETLDQLEKTLLKEAEARAEDFGLSVEIHPLGKISPIAMSEKAQEAFRQGSEILGLKHTPLTSLAAHDAQSVAEICPAGMIFVPSVGGFSHSSREFTEWQDCVNGANTIMHAALILASGDD